jgi:hypothetical protein
LSFKCVILYSIGVVFSRYNIDRQNNIREI